MHGLDADGCGGVPSVSMSQAEDPPGQWVSYRNGIEHSRGYVPHFEGPWRIQHVVFRLADSLPASVLAEIEGKMASLDPGALGIERIRRWQAALDAGAGSCLLAQESSASEVRSSLFRFDGIRYRLIAWAIMPNHVHVLIRPARPWTLSKIVRTWKTYTARRIIRHWREERGWPGLRRVWHPEYWDRYVRDAQHYERVVNYIHDNPVEAGLCSSAAGWKWSSAGEWVERPISYADATA